MKTSCREKRLTDDKSVALQHSVSGGGGGVSVESDRQNTVKGFFMLFTHAAFVHVRRIVFKLEQQANYV